MEEDETSKKQKFIPPQRWKPGQSGNPNGRPKGARTRSVVMREMLEAAAFKSITQEQRKALDFPEGFQQKTVLDQILAALFIKAAKHGDVSAIKEALDSAFGKVPDKQAFTDSEGEDLLTKTDEDILKRFIAEKTGVQHNAKQDTKAKEDDAGGGEKPAVCEEDGDSSESG